MSAFRVPRRMPGAPAEPPAWARSFNPEDWLEPDQLELDAAQTEEHQDWHRHRRWVEARNEWFRSQPGGQALQLRELLGGLSEAAPDG